MEYLYIEQTKTRVELHAKEDGWAWELDGKRYGITPEIERLMAFYINTYREGKFLELARLNLPKKAAASLSPQLMKSTFIKDHTVKTINNYNRSMIPSYADREKGLWVYGDGRTWSFWIADWEEKILLRQFKSAKGDGWVRCLKTLNEFATRQSLQFDNQTIEAALECFFEQHGIRPETVRDEDRRFCIQERNAGKNPVKDGVTLTNGGSLLLGIVTAALMALYWWMTFIGEYLGCVIAPLMLHLMAIMFEAGGIGNIRRPCARFYLILFAASGVTSILAMIYRWGYQPGLFSGGSDPEMSGLFSLIFSMFCLFVSHILYCEVD